MIDLKTVLVPTDFSELSLQALPYARELAREHRAEIVLAHACQHACDLDIVRRRLDELAAELAPLPHRVEVRVSSPVSFLVDLARGMERTLMVVATHAWHGPDRQVLGSVAERLVSRAPCAVLTLKPDGGFLRELEEVAPHLPDPTEVRGPELRQRPKTRDDFFFEQQDRHLVVESRKARQKEEARVHGRQTHRFQLGTILVPVDFSERGRQALAVAAGLARHYGASLTLLHVLEEGRRGKGRPEREAQRLDVARAQLEALKEEVAPVPCEVDVEAGPAADCIVARARRLSAGLIVIASRGRRSLVGIPLGSTAKVVVRRAGCPVLTVKGPNATELVGPLEDEDEVPSTPS